MIIQLDIYWYVIGQLGIGYPIQTGYWLSYPNWVLAILSKLGIGYPIQTSILPLEMRKQPYSIYKKTTVHCGDMPLLLSLLQPLTN